MKKQEQDKNKEQQGSQQSRRQEIQQQVRQQLFALQDLDYLEFHCRLIPTVKKEAIIGVRTPELRKFAKEFAKQPEAKEYLTLLPHQYYEENNLHGFIIETIKDYPSCVAAVDAFLPYVDNWATCDMMSPKVFQQHLPELLPQIKLWIQSDAVYTIRFGIEMLMTYFLEEEFTTDYLDLVASIHSDEYYVKMMIAWYFATALAKQYDATLPFIEQRRLEHWTHNKAIQKAIESLRLTAEQKKVLRSLKWRRNNE